MPYLPLIPILLILLLWMRTLLSHLQSWQLREYRLDRMRGYLRTRQGFCNIFNLWFFPGILPRPTFTFRVLLIIAFFIGINVAVWSSILPLLVPDLDIPHQILLQNCLNRGLCTPIILSLIILERLTWITAYLAIFISSVPVWIQKKRTFTKAKKIIDRADRQIIKIGIAGSFGKSSTKNILVHLFQSKFGEKNILFTPENLNQEYAIARMIIRHEAFFRTQERAGKRFFIFETGAYARGEIATIARVIRPDYSILTGLNSQHLETFGSLQNIQKAKTELTEYTTQKSFFNTDNQMLQEAMDQVQTKAEKIPISIDQAHEIKPQPHQTHFTYEGKSITLPWPGSFFVINALLCLRLLQEFQTPAHGSLLTDHCLDDLPPQNKALKTETHPQGFHVLKDLYSQNPDGTLQAIEHLGQSQGPRIFIGMPLLELSQEAESIHQKLFQALKKIDATVYWTKDDYADMGRKILSARFKKGEAETIGHDLKNWDQETTVLLEGRLPEAIVHYF